jgi:hypothetical protein
MMDLFVTALAAAGVAPPADRVLDGKDILPLLTSAAKSPHEAIFATQGPNLSTVRAGKWKLHVRPIAVPRTLKPGDKWLDPRRPDGVTLLAPYEQAHPSQYPGLLTGDPTKAGSLFDLETDPGEQRDVAAKHPDVVKRLRALFDKMQEQATAKK